MKRRRGRYGSWVSQFMWLRGLVITSSRPNATCNSDTHWSYHNHEWSFISKLKLFLNVIRTEIYKCAGGSDLSTNGHLDQVEMKSSISQASACRKDDCWYYAPRLQRHVKDVLIILLRIRSKLIAALPDFRFSQLCQLCTHCFPILVCHV